ncbi:MAG: hypothetical protein M1828_002153 [Chrysothrix sp. TS-e1954]|nr:MAG: hypothetical protein M1828_002153 [Chrysothrix sp. TS-e1954]
MKALCHCGDCKKISGSMYSTNAIVKPDTFKSSGQAKTHVKSADSGSKITSYFCPECGGMLWRETSSFGDMKIVKMGVLDDDLSKAKPAAELYAPQRPAWISAVAGTEDKQAMS